MKKSNWIKLGYAASFFVIAVLLVVGAVTPDRFAFTWLDGIIYLAAAWSVISLAAALLLEQKQKQGFLLVGWLLGVICFGVAIARGLDWYVAVILMVLYLAFLILVRSLLLRGMHWDKGDNQSPDYKDYKQRRAEEEAKKNGTSQDAPQDEHKKDE